MTDKMIFSMCVIMGCLLSIQLQAKEQQAKLPQDFSLSYETKTAGVIPSTTSFIRISKTKEDSYLLVKGEEVWDGKEKKISIYRRQILAEDACLKLYEEAKALGFYELKRYYTAEASGGISKSIEITANGKTKKVSTYEMQQDIFDKLVKVIEKL